MKYMLIHNLYNIRNIHIDIVHFSVENNLKTKTYTAKADKRTLPKSFLCTSFTAAYMHAYTN